LRQEIARGTCAYQLRLLLWREPSGSRDVRRARRAPKGSKVPRVCQAQKGSKDLQGFRVRKGSKAQQESKVLRGRKGNKGRQAQKGSKDLQGFRVRKGSEALQESRALRGRKEQRENKVPRGPRALSVKQALSGRQICISLGERRVIPPAPVLLPAALEKRLLRSHVPAEHSQ
jgi:hypothetical protein